MTFRVAASVTAGQKEGGSNEKPGERVSRGFLGRQEARRKCNDRDLLFVAANGHMGRGRAKGFFNFKRGWTRIVGVARGAVLMDAIGAGALPLLPAGCADLSGDGKHLSAEEVRFLHAAFATVNASGGRGLEAGKIAVSIVFSGHPKRRRGDEGMRLI